LGDELHEDAFRLGEADEIGMVTLGAEKNNVVVPDEGLGQFVE
jgi:hypothetical protein